MYIPFESVNLFLYTIDMLIFPLKYYKQNLNKSIQQIYPNHILISKNRWVENANISFEIDINESELIKLDDNFYLYPTALTFSKVINIFFQNKEQMKISVANITISTSPFPKHLLKVDNNQNSVSQPKKKRVQKPKDIRNNISLFSKYLGALALENKVTHKKIEFPQKKYFTNQKYREIEKLVLKRSVNKSDIEKFSKKENIKLELFLFEFYQLDKIYKKDSLTYISVILEKYRYKMNDNLAGLIEQNKNLNKDLQNIFIILYGLMLGYQNLPFLGIDTKFRFDQKEDFQILDEVYKISFREKIKKADRLKQLKTDIFEKNFDEILGKFGVSEVTLKPNIRQTILESDISVSKKIELFEKFNFRVPKNLRISKLKEILESAKFTSKELSEKLQVSVNTVRNYLKEIEVEKNYR